ncbi:unnamed protein product, partial [Agarophyton chilense]
PPPPPPPPPPPLPLPPLNPLPLPPQPTSETPPNLIESSTNTNVTNTTTTSQNANFALLRFLAVYNLPLSISSSHHFRQLFHLFQDSPNIPDLNFLRTTVLKAHVQSVHAKVSSALLNTDAIVLKVENGPMGHRFIVCEYFHPPLQRCTVLLDIVTEEEVWPPSAPAPHTPSLPPPHPSPASGYANGCVARRYGGRKSEHHKAVFERLILRISATVDRWKIRSKLLSIVLSEPIFSGDQVLDLYHMLPQTSGSPMELADRYKASRAQHHLNGGAELSYDEAHCDNAPLSMPRERLPIISCVIRTLTTILEQVVSHDDLIERRFIQPMSRAMHKVLSDRQFCLSEAAGAWWSTRLHLPMRDSTLWDLSSFLAYFSDHIETVRTVINRDSDNQAYDFLFVLKDDVVYLYSMVSIFVDAVKSLCYDHMASHSSPANGFANGSCTSMGEHTPTLSFTESLSAGIPALRMVLNKLEELPQPVSEEVRALKKLAMESLTLHLLCMEQQDVFLCSTILDPRYKQRYFSSKDHYMTSMIPGSTSSCSLTQYLSDQQSEKWRGEEYWRENQQRWPVLARVAGRYCLLAGVCDSEDVRIALERESNVRGEGSITGKEEQTNERLNMLFLRRTYTTRE